MAILDDKGLEYYDNKLKQYIMQNYSTDVKGTIAINTAREAKAMVVQRDVIPATLEDINGIFAEEEEEEEEEEEQS